MQLNAVNNKAGVQGGRLEIAGIFAANPSP